MARTNKMGILKKKQQQAKQKQLMGSSVSNLEGVKKEYTNEKGNTYKRFFRSGKWVCDTTSVREDPDGYRICRKANGGEVEFKFMGDGAWGYRKWFRKYRRDSAR